MPNPAAAAAPEASQQPRAFCLGVWVEGLALYLRAPAASFDQAAIPAESENAASFSDCYMGVGACNRVICVQETHAEADVKARRRECKSV